MRKLLIVILMAFTLHTAAQSDVTQLRNLYHRTWQAMIEKNADDLQAVHDKDFVLVHMTGKVQQRTAYIAEIIDSTLNYFHEQTDGHIEVRMTEAGRAELTAHSVVEASVYGGPRRTWHLLMHFRAIKRDQGWIFTHCRVEQY